MSTFKRAFTMIELIMVIVVLGIVGMIVTEVLAQAYKGAFYQQKYAEREVELERVLNIIEKRLKDALVDSIVLFDNTDTCVEIDQSSIPDYTAAFIAVDRDSMNGIWDNGIQRYQNGWSEQGAVGIVAGNTVVNSPDANFSAAQSIIFNVYGKQLAHPTAGAALYRYPMISDVCNNFGWDTGVASALDRITVLNTDTQVRISGGTGINAQQGYRLASTAFAFKRIPGTTVASDGNLMMYSNFRPWNSQSYTAGTASIVAEHVSHFAIRLDSGSAHSIAGNPSLNGAFYRINVCMKVVSDTSDTVNTEEDQICKEKSVYVR